MKINIQSKDERRRTRASCSRPSTLDLRRRERGLAALKRSESGFTMIEIAICLAVIGVALVGIIGVLPLGMNTQRANREETVVGQDANLLIQLISSGSQGANDLTNYVYAITNYQVLFAVGASAGTPISPPPGWDSTTLTNGAKIIGLLSTPELVDVNYNPTNNLFSGGYSNHIVAYVRALSGLAAEIPPQNNQIMLGDAFAYRLFVVNAPVAQDTNFNAQPYSQNLNASLHDLRLTFFWPLLPSGDTGGQRLTFRTSVAGQVEHQFFNGYNDLYYYQPQTFNATP